MKVVPIVPTQTWQNLIISFRKPRALDNVWSHICVT